MLHVSNDMEAVVSHKGESHHAISDLTLVNQPSPVAPGLEHPPQKWKVPGSNPSLVNTLLSVAWVDWCVALWDNAQCQSDGMTLSCSAVKLYARQEALIAFLPV